MKRAMGLFWALVFAALAIGCFIVAKAMFILSIDPYTSRVKDQWASEWFSWVPDWSMEVVGFVAAFGILICLMFMCIGLIATFISDDQKDPLFSVKVFDHGVEIQKWEDCYRLIKYEGSISFNTKAGNQVTVGGTYVVE